MREKFSANLVYLILSGGNTLADTIMFTVNMVYFVQTIGLSPLQLVLVGTVLEGSILLFEIPTGVIADTFSRKISIVTGWFIMASGFLLVGLIPQIWAVFLGQVLWGLGYTFTSGATEAWLADEIGEENVGRINIESGQINRILGITGSGISVAIASVALNLPIVVGGVIYLLMAVFLLFAMPETHFIRNRYLHHLDDPFRALLNTFREGAQVVRKSPLLLSLLLVEFFMGAASEGYDRLSSAHLLKNFQFPSLGTLQPVVWFGILNIVGSIASFSVTAVFKEKLAAFSQSSRLSARYLVVFHAISTAMVVVFALTGHFYLAILAILTRGVMGALIGPLYNAWLVQNIPSQTRATVFSMVGQANAFGQVGGGPGIGAIGNRSLRLAILLTALLNIPVLPLYKAAEKHGISPTLENNPDFTSPSSPISTKGMRGNLAL